MHKRPGNLVLPAVVLYVSAPPSSAGRAAMATYRRQLKAISRRSRADGVVAGMTLFGDPAAPRVDDVCPSLAWIASRAREAPMPRLLYVADLADLATDRTGLLATLDDLFEADVDLRVCESLLSARGRRLAAFCAVNAPGPVAPHVPVSRPRGRSGAPSPAARTSRGP